MWKRAWVLVAITKSPNAVVIGRVEVVITDVILRERFKEPAFHEFPDARDLGRKDCSLQKPQSKGHSALRVDKKRKPRGFSSKWDQLRWKAGAIDHRR